MIRRAGIYVMATLYFFAGLNHFIRPEMYLKIMPPYLPFHSFIVYASGIIEMFLAVLLVIPRTRRGAATLIIVMLLAFLPVHIYMLQPGWCNGNSCPPAWFGWVRLLVIQPLLILWAWDIRRHAKKYYL